MITHTVSCPIYLNPPQLRKEFADSYAPYPITVAFNRSTRTCSVSLSEDIPGSSDSGKLLDIIRRHSERINGIMKSVYAALVDLRGKNMTTATLPDMKLILSLYMAEHGLINEDGSFNIDDESP